MSEFKTAERLALVRAEARTQLPALDSADKIGTDTYLLKVENGVAKVTISAVKDESFDITDAVANYEDALVEKKEKANAKAEAKAAKEAAKEAKKA